MEFDLVQPFRKMVIVRFNDFVDHGGCQNGPVKEVLRMDQVDHPDPGHGGGPVDQREPLADVHPDGFQSLFVEDFFCRSQHSFVPHFSFPDQVKGQVG